MKIFLDTNFLLRLFLKDNDQQFKICYQLISQIEEGLFKPYTSGIVFLEMSYVLKSVYKIPFQEINKILYSVFEIRGLTIIERTKTKQSLELFKKYKIKFTDCLIAAQLPKGNILVSFDQELSKIKEITVKTPQQLLS
ncbi:MAG: PIN domain-containing protein [Candidatus Daviesbacteria bacterium]|nr:PIN domain-containing protein [Candidatus Daviesbacteria bacterium]